MSFNVDQFRTAMMFDGARSNLFEVRMNFPTILNNAQGITSSNSIRFFANSTQLPPSIIGVARQSYFGREVKFPGNRTFQPWTINVVNDESFNLRDTFESWLNLINNHTSNTRDAFAINALDYSVNAEIVHFGKDGGWIKSYMFTGLFPTQVDPINLSWAQNDTIEEFGVTFEYQYWVADNIKTGTSTPV